LHRSKEEAQAFQAEKQAAIKAVIGNHASAKLHADDIERVLCSISDSEVYQMQVW
jgi:hypothetical protein